MNDLSFVAMRRFTRTLGTLALLAAATASLAQTPAVPADKPMTKGTAMPDKADPAMKAMPGMAGGDAMHESMMGSMKSMESMKMSGDKDRDFAMMMKVHHQGAVDMARMELKSGRDPTMKAMAKRIIVAQQKEIREFDQWLEKRK